MLRRLGLLPSRWREQALLERLQDEARALLERGEEAGAERLLTLSTVYGFWRHVSNLEREETRRYLQMFYNLQLRPLAEGLRN